jgi:hypothetical protein
MVVYPEKNYLNLLIRQSFIVDLQSEAPFSGPEKKATYV